MRVFGDSVRQIRLNGLQIRGSGHGANYFLRDALQASPPLAPDLAGTALRCQVNPNPNRSTVKTTAVPCPEPAWYDLITQPPASFFFFGGGGALLQALQITYPSTTPPPCRQAPSTV